MVFCANYCLRIIQFRLRSEFNLVCNNSINFVQALSYLDWMGNFYFMPVIYPLQTRAELYRLDSVEDTSSIGLTGQSDCLKETWKSEQCLKSI